jgi:catechol 2,3-dioxygenase-like lactoylglutathione lyase family enzyme
VGGRLSAFALERPAERLLRLVADATSDVVDGQIGGPEQRLGEVDAPLGEVADRSASDLIVSAPWYEAVFGTDPVIDEDTEPDLHHTVWVVGTGLLIGLHQHATPAPVEAFSEYRVGLDHVSFAVASRDELERWAVRLDELGIAHGDIKDAHDGSGLAFRTPDGIAPELFAPPA